MFNKQFFTSLFIVISMELSGCSHQLDVDKSTLASAVYQGSANTPLIYFNDDGILQLDRVQLRQSALVINLSESSVLTRLLKNTPYDAYKADDTFGTLHTTIGNQNQPTPNAFTQSLTNYLIKPQFPCQQPLYYRYFQHRYRYYDVEADCNGPVPFHIMSALDGGEIRWISPEKVDAVHLLFAASDDHLASRFGHVLVRLIVCPDKIENNRQEECARNVHEHLVLGYSAHINERNLNTLKALKGDYRAYLYAHDFMDTYQDYSIAQFRDLHSLPLKMQKTEREDLVRYLSEAHWSYSGNYKFFTNNCSTLLQQLLRHVWTDFSQASDTHSEYFRPDSFFKAMQESSLTNNAYEDDLINAENHGFYFPSTEPVYEKALATIHLAADKTLYKNLESYLSTNPVIRYQTAVNTPALYDKLLNDQHILGAQLTLESLSVIYYENLMRQKLSHFFEKNDIQSVKEKMQNHLDSHEMKIFEACIEYPISSISSPVKRTNGIPSTEEAKIDDHYLKICSAPENYEIIEYIRNIIGSLDPDRWASFKKVVLLWVESMNNFERFSVIKGKL